ncbi:MAG: transcriptional regulator [Actinomycetota bacterium]|nr:transcriptional regulator [Actinomycetota bacterium]
MTDLARASEAIGALSDNLRRRMYLFIRSQRRPVSRDEAASQVGISRKLAAFHLDKLVERGLLVAHYARPAHRSTSLAGRSSKMYEPSDIEIEVSVPQRRYDTVGRILVETVATTSQNESPQQVSERVAFEHGKELGADVRTRQGLRPPGAERALNAVASVLEDQGYEPYRTECGAVALRNCPFHDLAATSPGVVCQMNRSFIDGVLRGLGNESLDARLTPTPGQCCVTVDKSEEIT